ncbi:MAG: PD40 domain-containing protein [Candidatus Hydrogenedentes bacterium]|nr:PD40 domain-containing protein [Candidatus Hydrogenedentota bacterium]
MILGLYLLAAAYSGAPGGQIAFVAGTGQGTRCACVLDLRSKSVRRVGPGGHDGAPRWSPDGVWLAFPSKYGEGMGIYVARADSAEGCFLNTSRRWNHRPVWSPDGKRLVFAASQEGTLAQRLVVYDLASHTEAEWGGGREGLLDAVWAPNLDLMRALDPEEKVTWEGLDTGVFLAEAAAEGALVAAGLTGTPGRLSTELYLVTRTQVAPLLAFLLPPGASYAEWAPRPDPDGERFAFESNDGGDREIFVLGKRGIGDVSNHREADWSPVWSPDGGYLAFESFRGGRRGIYAVYPETARVFAVAAGANYDCWAPDWSPDEEWLVYVSDRGGNPDLYVARRDGSETLRLTETTEAEYAPAWRPEQAE